MNDPNASFEETKQAFYQEFGTEPGPKHSGWKQFKRWEWFMEQRLNEDGSKPDQRLIYQEVKRAELQQAYRGGTSNWQLIGPTEEPQNDHGRSIGRICAIAFHPTDSNQMWVGAPAGGIWKSTDNGDSWAPLGDQLPNLGVSDIVIHPSSPDTMYMSTGDGSTDHTYSYGILKSFDGGETWDSTGLSFGVNETENIRRLLLDTSNTNVLIAAGTDGIFRTEDAGETWEKEISGNFCDMEFKPFSTDTIYAAKGNSAGSPFYVSYDNGLTWNPSTTGLSSSITRMKIAVTPSNPEIIYAITGKGDGGMDALYRSDNAGATWTVQADHPNLMSGDQFGAEDGGQAWYSMDIAVSRTNENLVKVGGINLWESTDRGQTWLQEAHWYGANGTYVHADHHRLEFSPITNQFYTGNDGGLYRRSYYFAGYEPISTEMSISQFYRLSNAASDPTFILGGTQDNGTFRWNNNGWLAIFGGDGMESMIDPQDPNKVFVTTQNGNLHRSADGGQSFTDDLFPQGGAWVTPFMMDPENSDVLYGASSSIIYRSDDSGNDWYEFSDPLHNPGSLGSLITLDVCENNTEYVLTGSRRTLNLTKDLGGIWENIKPGLPNINITYAAFDPLDENTIWVTFSGYTSGSKVYRSTDAGETWENMSMNLPNLPVNCVEIERSSAGGVYVGTDVGVYYWDRTLTEWEPYMTGLPNVIVSELKVHDEANMIRAATFGRGIWESETRNFINVGIEETEDRYETQVKVWPNPATDQLNISFKAEGLPFEIIDAYGRVVSETFNQNSMSSVKLNVQHLASGVYYLRTTGGDLIGRFIAKPD